MNEKQNKIQPALIGLDSMCTDCFIQRNAVNRLQLRLRMVEGGGFACRGLGDTLTVLRQFVVVRVGPRNGSILVKAYVVENICGDVGYVPEHVINKYRQGRIPLGKIVCDRGPLDVL